MESERTITSPLVEERASASEGHNQPMPSSNWNGSSTSSTRKVLIVDDNFMNRIVARNLWSLADMHVLRLKQV